jgi:tRNA A-37 threonylcarbamoyl transferase component Bud32
MREVKDTVRSVVHVGYDGRVRKTYRGTDAAKRFQTEVKILKLLESRGCPFVPRLLSADEPTLTITTSNCGSPAESITEAKAKEVFAALEEFGVRHDDPFPRNITYDHVSGQFCVIDFELAEVLW